MKWMWKLKTKKTMKKKKKKKEKKPNVNLIFSDVDHIFLIFDPWIGPQAFRHSLHLRKKWFFLCEEGSNSRFNLVQIDPWAFGP
jgi:hypothetical protein